MSEMDELFGHEPLKPDFVVFAPMREPWYIRLLNWFRQAFNSSTREGG